jgi:glycine/D-amino acid oxidase-like deaminating enzyme
LDEQNLLSYKAFIHDHLKLGEDYLSYNNLAARHIVFAEGYGIHANIYFNNLPLDGTKGEILIIKAPGLQLDVSVNAGIFILPIGNSLFKVGATYNWNDKTQATTSEGRDELLEKIREVLNCEFQVVDHLAGVRPTTRDRKAVIGSHPYYNRLHVLNGLGTRGVMLAPAMAQALLNHIDHKTPLPREVDIARFYNSWPRQVCS